MFCDDPVVVQIPPLYMPIHGRASRAHPPARTLGPELLKSPHPQSFQGLVAMETVASVSMEKELQSLEFSRS